MKDFHPDALRNFAPECGSRADYPWYCVQVHPHAEMLALWHIQNQGMQTYTPFVLKKRKPPSNVGRPRKDPGPQYLPLFPGYVFVTFDEHRDRWQHLFNTHGVKRVFIWNNMRPQRVPPRAITLAEANSYDTATTDIARIAATISLGETLRITDGPFAGQEAIAHLKEPARITVLLSLLGQSCPVTVPYSAVAKLTRGLVPA